MTKAKIDLGTAAVIAVTTGLFILAVFVKGIGKDLLLEAGVLMVSVKLILMSLKNASESEAIRKDLDRIVMLLEDRRERTDPDHDSQMTGGYTTRRIVMHEPAILTAFTPGGILACLRGEDVCTRKTQTTEGDRHEDDEPRNPRICGGEAGGDTPARAQTRALYRRRAQLRLQGSRRD